MHQKKDFENLRAAHKRSNRTDQVTNITDVEEFYKN